MKLVILGLKEKSNGKLYIYDSETRKQSSQVKLGDTLNIKILDPFPFNHFTTIDNYDESVFEQCYLQVEGELSESEYKSMKSTGIVYHRFKDRQVTILNEFHDIFQYSYEKLKEFGKKLGTYDLTTWVLHSKTINAAEESAMKSIIFEDVKNRKSNKRYPLDIRLNKYSIHYVDYFRELSEKGYYITFGKGGRNEITTEEFNIIPLSDETLLYLVKSELHNDITISHAKFTVEFYDKYIKGTDYELEFIWNVQYNLLQVLSSKGIDVDELFKKYYPISIENCLYDESKYENVIEMFKDEKYTPFREHTSPYDYYCCEDCDGYVIREMYTDEELKGKWEETDERLVVLYDVLRDWDNFLTDKSFEIFDFVSTEILEKYQNEYENSVFIEKLLNFRKVD